MGRNKKGIGKKMRGGHIAKGCEGGSAHPRLCLRRTIERGSWKGGGEGTREEEGRKGGTQKEEGEREGRKTGISWALSPAG